MDACPEDEDPEGDAEYEFELFHVLEGILCAVMFGNSVMKDSLESCWRKRQALRF